MIPNQKNTTANPALLEALKTHIGDSFQLREGAVVDAELMEKSSRNAFFRVGDLGTGIVYGREYQNARDILRGLTQGDKVPARVESVVGHNGYIELSLSEADKQKAWQEAKELEESGELIETKIIGANQGGLLADFSGIRAFIPASQISPEHAPRVVEGDKEKLISELQKLVGEELKVKVITVNPRAHKLILSERNTLEQNDEVKALIEKYEVGQDVSGSVSGIADFGIFVQFADEPQIEGLVHISELAHRIVDSPNEIVEMGQSVKVKIIEIKDGRVYLSLKALEEDSWEVASKSLKDGQEVEGEVYKFNPFGAVINLDNSLQGLIHISEFGGQEEMRSALEKSKKRSFIVQSIKPEEKRIILKLKK